MDRRNYLTPETYIIEIESESVICSSITGVEGTGNMSTDVGGGSTDVVMSKGHGFSIWEDTEEE